MNALAVVVVVIAIVALLACEHTAAGSGNAPGVRQPDGATAPVIPA